MFWQIVIILDNRFILDIHRSYATVPVTRCHSMLSVIDQWLVLFPYLKFGTFMIIIVILSIDISPLLLPLPYYLYYNYLYYITIILLIIYCVLPFLQWSISFQILPCRRRRCRCLRRPVNVSKGIDPDLIFIVSVVCVCACVWRWDLFFGWQFLYT